MLSRTLSSWGRLLGLGRGSAPGEEERRAFGRIPCDLETTCRPTGRERDLGLNARVKNISRSGVCLVVARAFKPGELLSVSLPAASSDEASEVLACVVRCDPDLAEHWEVGCTFATPLGAEDLRRFGRDEGTVQAEQRTRARFVCRAQAVYQVVRTPEPTPGVAARVLNVSGGGIAMMVTEPLSVGDLLSVELRRDGAAVLTALASVVRTTADQTSERLVGCNFIHELPEEQVARLLA